MLDIRVPVKKQEIMDRVIPCELSDMFQKTLITTEDLERLDILLVRRDKETRYERITSDDEVQAPRHQAKNLATADRQSFSKEELSDLVGAILDDDDKLFEIHL